MVCLLRFGWLAVTILMRVFEIVEFIISCIPKSNKILAQVRIKPRHFINAALLLILSSLVAAIFRNPGPAGVYR